MGDIVRVRLRRETAADAVSYSDFLYEIDRIDRQSIGPITYDLTHFPIDSAGCSVLAKDVSSATGGGVTIAQGRSGFACDLNSGSGTLSDVGIDAPAFDDTPSTADVTTTLTPTDSKIGDGDAVADDNYSDGQPYSPSGAVDNPEDDLEQATGGTYSGYSGTEPKMGDTVTYAPGCAGAWIDWYSTPIAGGDSTKISSNSASYEVTAALASQSLSVYGVGRCPDGKGGYGPAIEGASIPTGMTSAGIIASHVGMVQTEVYVNIGSGSSVSGKEIKIWGSADESGANPGTGGGKLWWSIEFGSYTGPREHSIFTSGLIINYDEWSMLSASQYLLRDGYEDTMGTDELTADDASFIKIIYTASGDNLPGKSWHLNLELV